MSIDRFRSHTAVHFSTGALKLVASNDLCHHTNPRSCESKDLERIIVAAR